MLSMFKGSRTLWNDARKKGIEYPHVFLENVLQLAMQLKLLRTSPPPVRDTNKMTRMELTQNNKKRVGDNY